MSAVDKNKISLPVQTPQICEKEQFPLLPISVPIINNPNLSSKLSRKEIYQKIDDVICKVHTSKGSATGFCIGKNLIIVPFHVLNHSHSNTSGLEVESPISCTYQGITYEAKYRTQGKLHNINYDFAIFTIEDEDFLSFPDLCIFDGVIEPGEKVYFGGFPLTQETPTFHGGIVSSVVEEEGKLSFFTIDGTVVPGNSGGPVFVLHNNQLELIGAITRQLADIGSGSEKLIDIIKQLKFQMDQKNREKPYKAITTHIHEESCSNFNKHPESEETYFSEIDAISMTIDLMLSNLSTGIGTVLHVKHLMEILGFKAPTSSIPSINGMPVMRGERLPGMLSQNLAYRNWYHRQVKGQSICGEVIGRNLGAADDITQEEEKVLWNYYQNNPHYNDFKELNIKDKLEKLRNKVLSAKPKALNKNKYVWKMQLEEFKKYDTSLASEVDELLKQLG